MYTLDAYHLTSVRCLSYPNKSLENMGRTLYCFAFDGKSVPFESLRETHAILPTSGIPIIPKIKNAAIKFGTTPIKDNLIFLNKITNIEKIPTITKPKVKICDLNKL